MKKKHIVFAISLLFITMSIIGSQIDPIRKEVVTTKSSTVTLSPVNVEHQSSATPTPSVSTQIPYGGCLEMPAMSCGTSSTFIETFGGATGHKHTVNGNPNQVIITHVVEEDGKLKRNYTMLFDKTKKAPLWSACVIHQGYFPDVVTRTETWTIDPALSKAEQQDGTTYGSGGYARGHITASADRLSSIHCNNQTFYSTNIAPQLQNSFNSGVWSRLERKTQKDWNPSVGSTDTLYMVSGVVYKEDIGVTTKGEIEIPSHFYKVLVKCKFDGASVSSAQGIGFYYENRAHKGASFDDATYVKSIDWIEEQAGFDFFSNLPLKAEQTAEANTNFTTFTNF